MKSDTRPSARCFRTDAVHRLLGGTGSAYTLGAGFLLKPDVRGWHCNWRPDHYAGVLVLRGRGLYVDRLGREHELLPGTFFQRVPGRTHTTTQVPDGGWAECFVRFGAGLFEELARLGVLDAGRPVLHPGLAPALPGMVEEILGHLKEPGEAGAHRALAGMQALVVEVCDLDRRGRQADPDAALLAAACRRLSRDLHLRLELPGLAEELGCGYERFRKLFRARLGISPGEYRIRRRMERAYSLLVAGGLAVKEAAYELGYPDAFTFSKQFRQVVGIAPSEVRNV